MASSLLIPGGGALCVNPQSEARFFGVVLELPRLAAHISGPRPHRGSSVDIDPDGKLLRKALEIGMTRGEAEEWLRYVEAAGDVDAAHIARTMPLAFFHAPRASSRV